MCSNTKKSIIVNMMWKPPEFWNMKRLLVSVNTCNTHNFGIQDHPRDTSAVKGYCLTATGYPTRYGLTHRTYIMEIEDADRERAGVR